MSGARRILAGALVAIVVAASGSAAAQALYRWTDAEGKTHYGDRPPKSAIGVTKVDTGPETNTLTSPLVPPPKATPAAAEPAPKAVPADRATQRRDDRTRLRADLNRALEKLAQAQKNLAEGGDLQDDERQVVQQRAGRPPITPTARQNCRQERGQDGKMALMCPVSVPNDQYYDRISKLEDAVRQAEAQVAAAESAYRRGVD